MSDPAIVVAVIFRPVVDGSAARSSARLRAVTTRTGLRIVAGLPTGPERPSIALAAVQPDRTAIGRTAIGHTAIGHTATGHRAAATTGLAPTITGTTLCSAANNLGIAACRRIAGF